ncbi:MAG: YkgJ family cysteine cluster protein [Spirochaetota bacterium]
MKTCKRRGYCCQDVRLAEPPDMLERAYNYWKKIKSIDPEFSEIYLIYPMLEFKHENPEEDLPYHYRCKHFSHDADGLPACSIYEIRPRMCRDFPYYEDVKSLDRDEPLSPYEGCGYNDPD